MCAQFLIQKNLKELESTLGINAAKSFDFPMHSFPKSLVPVVVHYQEKNWIAPMQFGFIPFFEKAEKPKSVFHNARVETVFDKPSFKKEIRKNRCLVYVDAFIEPIWKEGENKASWIRFDLEEPESWMAVGVWSVWKSPDQANEKRTFALLTRDPYPIVKEMGHNRSPLFLPKAVWSNYLDPNLSEVQLKELLQKFTGSQARNDGPILRTEKITK